MAARDKAGVPSPAKMWKALFDLAVAASNRSPEALAANLSAVADLAESAEKQVEARRIRQLAQNHSVPLTHLREYVVAEVPQKGMEDLLLPGPLRAVVEDLVRERAAADKLRGAAIPVASRILLMGPPGCGKTSLAHALAAEFGLPLFRLSTQTIFGSYLGETAGRVAKVLDQAQQKPCMLLIDEADALFWRRTEGGGGEGEMRRVVAAVLPLLEKMSDTSVVVAATNAGHEMLDGAVMRRFDLCLQIPGTFDAGAVAQLAVILEKKTGVSLGLLPADFVQACLCRCCSLAEVERVLLAATKKVLISGQAPADALAWAVQRQAGP